MKGIRIRPEQEGLRTALFDLEADIMEIVWDDELSSFAVSEIHAVLSRGREIAYTTVMTTVARLHHKGLLARVRDGRRYLYSPRMDRAAFTQEMARELLESLDHMSHEQALSLLVDQVAGSDASELERLEALIRRKRKELGR